MIDTIIIPSTQTTQTAGTTGVADVGVPSASSESVFAELLGAMVGGAGVKADASSIVTADIPDAQAVPVLQDSVQSNDGAEAEVAAVMAGMLMPDQPLPTPLKDSSDLTMTSAILAPVASDGGPAPASWTIAMPDLPVFTQDIGAGASEMNKAAVDTGKTPVAPVLVFDDKLATTSPEIAAVTEQAKAPVVSQIPLTADGKQLDANVEVMPVSKDVMPVSKAVLPVNTAVLPVSKDAMPVNTAAIPVNTTAMPVNTAAMPVNSESEAPKVLATGSKKESVRTSSVAPLTNSGWVNVAADVVTNVAASSQTMGQSADNKQSSPFTGLITVVEKPLDSEDDTTLERVSKDTFTLAGQSSVAQNSNNPTVVKGSEVAKTPDMQLHQRVIDQVVRDVKLYNFDGRSDLVVRLNPPELGALRIHVAYDGQSMASTIEAGNGQVRGLLQANLPALMDALASAGLRVGSVSVTSGSSFDLSMQNHGHGNAQQQTNHPRHQGAGNGSSTLVPDMWNVPDAAYNQQNTTAYSWLA